MPMDVLSFDLDFSNSSLQENISGLKPIKFKQIIKINVQKLKKICTRNLNSSHFEKVAF